MTAPTIPAALALDAHARLVTRVGRAAETGDDTVRVPVRDLWLTLELLDAALAAGQAVVCGEVAA